MISSIVTDIEGTTSSISFVHEVLFPYASENLEAFVMQHQNETTVQTQLSEAASIAQINASDIPAIIKQLLQWVADDQKVTPLKALQGMIWKSGYENGDFQGHIYDDAYLGLKRWHKSGIKLYVYSSGSVTAQKLLFAHTKYGNLDPLFTGNFDTRIGGKKQAIAYQKILDELNKPAQEVLFLSDILEELDAAKTAGMFTCWLVRKGQKPNSDRHLVVDSFEDIALEYFK
mgnify:CR=1 FL=1